MPIKLNGETGGSVSFDAPDNTSPSGTDVTLTLPTSAGSAGQYLRNSSTAGTLEFGSLPTLYQTQLFSSQATTSGSAVDFVIPSWAQRITVMTLETSTTGGAQYIQLGTGGSPTTTGYSWYGAVTGAGTSGVSDSNGFKNSGTGAANVENSKWVIQNYEGNTWSAFLVNGTYSSGLGYYGCLASGHIALSGTLDILRFATSAAFDAGEVTIFVEG